MKDAIHLTLRVPADSYLRAVRRAQVENMSLNALIVDLLETHMRRANDPNAVQIQPDKGATKDIQDAQSGSEVTCFSLRVPGDLYGFVVERARLRSVSVNTQIVQVLELYVWRPNA